MCIYIYVYIYMYVYISIYNMCIIYLYMHCIYVDLMVSKTANFPPKRRGANGRFQLPCASLEVPGSTGSMMNSMGLCDLFIPDGLRMV